MSDRGQPAFVATPLPAIATSSMNPVQSKTNATASDARPTTMPTVAEHIASITRMGALIRRGLANGNILSLTKEHKHEMVNTGSCAVAQC